MTPKCPKCKRDLDSIRYDSIVNGNERCVLDWNAETLAWEFRSNSWVFDANEVFDSDMRCSRCDAALELETDSSKVVFELDYMETDELLSYGLTDEDIMEVKL